MLDLGQELSAFLRDLESSYLIRHSTEIKCNCIDPVTLDAKATCTICGGSGQRFELAPVRAARQLGSSTDAYPFLMFQGEMGRTAIAAVRFYMRPDARIRTGDELWEVEWRGDQPVALHTVYRITYVDSQSMADFNGIYLRAYGHPAPEQMRISRFIVKSNAGLPVYEPIFQGGAL